MYFLDTDILVGLLRNNKSAVDKILLLSEKAAEIYTSSINIHELVKGAHLSNNPTRNLEKINALIQTISILPFDKDCSLISGKLSAEQETKGRPIGQNDLLIASIALSNKLKLVTRNKKHFENIEDIQIEEW